MLTLKDILTILLISSIPLEGKFQPINYLDDNCEGKLSVKTRLYSNYPFNDYNTFLENFLNKKEQEYISSKNSLIKLNRIVNLENEITYKYNKSIIKVILKDTIGIDTYNMDYYYNLPKIDYYGELFKGQNKIIDSIYIVNESNEIFRLPNDQFIDLLNINTNNYYKSYRSVESYIDKKKGFLCLYMTGRIKDDSLFDFINFGGSYVVKFIFDLRLKKWDRIIIPSGYLASYGWLRCENFWPF